LEWLSFFPNERASQPNAAVTINIPAAIASRDFESPNSHAFLGSEGMRSKMTRANRPSIAPESR
jgi:hypothetical protein